MKSDTKSSENSKARLTIDLTPEQHQALKMEAVRRRTTMKQLIVEAISDMLLSPSDNSESVAEAASAGRD